MKDTPMTRAGQAVLATVFAVSFWWLVLNVDLSMPHIHISFFDGMAPNAVMSIVCGVLFLVGCIVTVLVTNHNDRVEKQRIARRDAHLAELRRQKEPSQTT